MQNLLTKTANKNGTFTYTVTNEQGEILSTRTSKRDNYIACTRNGSLFFSRLDLIGKGDSKKFFEFHPKEFDQIAYL